MITVKRWAITNVGGKAEKLEPSCATAENKNGAGTLRKQVGTLVSRTGGRRVIRSKDWAVRKPGLKR